jgi:BCD family chlorophyll transporter-like MFS transporter
MLLLGTIASALVFGLALQEFSPGRLVKVIQGAALATLVLNSLALWKQEPRQRGRLAEPAAEQGFGAAWRQFMQGPQALRRLVAIALGTLAFGMQDVLLEPYGGLMLAMSVGQTTLLTATLASGGLLGFALASVWLGRQHAALAATSGQGPGSAAASAAAWRVCSLGATLGVPAFALVALAAPLQSVGWFVLGVGLVGLGLGLFGHGSLTATMNDAPAGQTGLALGAWGAVQATAAGVAVAAGGLLADSVASFSSAGFGFRFVYLFELALLLVTIVVMAPLWRRSRRATGASV